MNVFKNDGKNAHTPNVFILVEVLIFIAGI